MTLYDLYDRAGEWKYEHQGEEEQKKIKKKKVVYWRDDVIFSR